MGDLTLSYSSSNLILGCEQKYWHYKVAKTAKDFDVEENYKAFNIGKAFHDILEESLHLKPNSITQSLQKCRELYDLEDIDVALVHGMVLKYLRGVKGNGFHTVHCELEIKDKYVLGFIDLISKRDDGTWVITDLKTAKTVFPTTIKMLPRNRQLNLYASFAKKIAPFLDLDPDKFLGCTYRVVTKPSLKLKKTESYSDYVLRIANSAKFFDFMIPVGDMNPQGTYDEHVRLFKIAKKLHDGKKEPTKNYNYCESYFRPCDYWSQCHGKCFSEIDVKDLGNGND